MYFKRYTIVFIAIFIIILSFNVNSYAAREWNLISETSLHSNSVPAAGADYADVIPTAVGDFDGDGYDDIAVGTSNLDDGNSAHIYFGDADGISPSHDFEIWGKVVYPEGGGEGEESGLGLSLANAGDIDKDGKDDLIIGAPNLDTGYVVVVLGSRITQEKTVGDGIISLQNNDPVDIMITGATDPEGKPINSKLGMNVASGGDLNKNGYPEILISEGIGESAETFRVYVFLGEDLEAELIPDAQANLKAAERYAVIGSGYAGFGISTYHKMGSAGDLNNDTYEDMIITSPAYIPYQGASSTKGAAFIYFGGPPVPSGPKIDTNVDLTIEIPYINPSGQEIDTFFGFSFASDFDIDGDSYDDLLIGAPVSGPLKSGTAYLFFGSEITSQMSSGPIYDYTLNDYITFYGEYQADGFGWSVGAFDANSDGLDDIIIGAPDARDDGTGRAYYARGKSRSVFKNSFDNIIVGSFVNYDEVDQSSGKLRIVKSGDKTGIGIVTGKNNNQDLFLFAGNPGIIRHCAIVDTDALAASQNKTIIGGMISSTYHNNLTAANSPYIVRADLTVPAGVTLTINPEVSVLFNPIKFTASGYSEDMLELTVLGRVIAEGTPNLGYGNEDIVFGMNSIANTKFGGWLGINLDDGGSAVIKNCNITSGVNGIWVDRARLTLESSTVSYNGGVFRSALDCDVSVCNPPIGNGVYVKSGYITPFKNNRISWNENNGLSIDSPDDSSLDPKNVLDEITENYFINNIGGDGIKNSDGSLVVREISKNTIGDNGGNGLGGFSKALITENVVFRNAGEGITNVDKSVITYNTTLINDVGIFATDESEIRYNIACGNLVGIAVSESTVSNNFIGVMDDDYLDPGNLPGVDSDDIPISPPTFPYDLHNFFGILATSRVDISKNNVSYNYYDGMWLDSNPVKEESSAIVWQNEITYNGDNGIWLFNASPKISGNNIEYNGRRGVSGESNGIKSDSLSRPSIRQNNITNNADMGLRLFHSAPTNPNEPFILRTYGNWWGTPNLSEIYDLIWDVNDDDISILGEVIPSPAKSRIVTLNVTKPSSGDPAVSSVLECFVASASYNKREDNKKSMLIDLFEAIDNMIFKR